MAVVYGCVATDWICFVNMAVVHGCVVTNWICFINMAVVHGCIATYRICFCRPSRPESRLARLNGSSWERLMPESTEGRLTMRALRLA